MKVNFMPLFRGKKKAMNKNTSTGISSYYQKHKQFQSFIYLLNKKIIIYICKKYSNVSNKQSSISVSLCESGIRHSIINYNFYIEHYNNYIEHCRWWVVWMLRDWLYELKKPPKIMWIFLLKGSPNVYECVSLYFVSQSLYFLTSTKLWLKWIEPKQICRQNSRLQIFSTTIEMKTANL